MGRVCPDCGKTHIVEVVIIPSSCGQPLLQCLDCMRVFVPPNEDYDWERDEWKK